MKRPFPYSVAAKIDSLLATLFGKLMQHNFLIYGTLLFMLLLSSKLTLFDLVLTKDAFHYVQKAMELTQGDWQIFQPQALGWSLFQAVFFKLGHVDTIFQAMFVASWLSIFLMYSSIIPLAMICRNVCPPALYSGLTTVVITGYLTNPLITSLAPVGYTEPLFIFLTLFCFVFLTRENPGLKEFFLAALFAGLSYWVRANGLFQLFAILGVILFRSEWSLKIFLSRSLVAIITFFTVAAPHLVLRYIQFGSPFDYGPNSKYFVDSFTQVWDDKVATPSLADYIATHGSTDFYHKFIENGLFRVLDLFPYIIPPVPWLVLILVALGYILSRRINAMYGVILMLVLTIAGFSLVFDIFGHIRHLVFLIPFLLLLGTLAITYLPRKALACANILFFLLIVFMVIDCPPMVILKKNHVHLPEVKDTWALWAADNLEGKVALCEGSDYLRLAQHYQKPAKNRVARSFDQVQEWIIPVRIQNYPNLEDAFTDLQQRGIRYLIKDAVYGSSRPFLQELDSPYGRAHFQRLQHFPNGDRGAALFFVTLYQLKK